MANFPRRASAVASVRARFIPVLAALVVAGCTPAPPGGDAPPEQPEPVTPPVAVQVIDEQGFADVLNRHRGRVVLADFWATWCSSCVEQLPHTVALQEELGEEGLTVITVSLDDPAQKDAVLRVLEDKGVTTANYLSQHGGSGKSMEVFAIEDGTLPHYKLYDREGNVARTFTSGGQNIEPDEIDRAIKALLPAEGS